MTKATTTSPAELRDAIVAQVTTLDPAMGEDMARAVADSLPDENLHQGATAMPVQTHPHGTIEALGHVVDCPTCWLGSLTVEDFAAHLGPPTTWAHQCHAISRALLDWPELAERFPQRRVARGSCRGVAGQHSWVVLGTDCYDEDTLLLDLVLWSYDATKPVKWVGTLRSGLHQPHGAGNIFDWGKPEHMGEADVVLTPSTPLSDRAKLFLGVLGPLDRRGWNMLLSHAPVGGWPAGELIAAALDTPELAALVPIDRAGMLTDRNPSGLYLPGEEVDG